ncbi:hypothetical protein T552_01715 [Pneumocystis carinii B80]|uniref:DNA mismatch repair protein S5 domain-containing protein n=1 Tax=Pneumocystis carinii (strain B80) TaxID=1408658 RepID=A0A0W4ZJE3_PNEC8|nr:hypothetical protein T552_01715 [Pneumocystis carinii B80]KTW28453.1 hypothetical protein T552_01715 [Pneumocystis carinii B80]
MDESTNSDLRLSKRILPLDIAVVSKIAAGEIIRRPCNALKELIENCVDAGATSIDILVKGGGLKLLQVSDNGHGIMKEDLPILCERFTTSKLRTLEDLSSISTYGFRGEALASISYISFLTIITKTTGSSCAWEANYLNGKLISPKLGESSNPKPAAGKKGTQIVVKDLFYNTPSRLKSFSSANDEYVRILDIIYRYAIHCEKISFSCKNYGDTVPSISISSRSTVVERIKQLYGTTAGFELLPFSLTSQDYMFQAQGFITNTAYSARKTVFLLFINHRSVDCNTLKSRLESIYSSFSLNSGYPFMYISLEIDSSRVDVNIHPTKREVHFFNENEIIDLICDKVCLELSKTYSSKELSIHSLKTTTNSSNADTDCNSIGKKGYDKFHVRTDAKFRTITSLLNVNSFNSKKVKRSNSIENFYHEPLYETNNREKVVVRLASIKELRDEVLDRRDDVLTNILMNHIFIGVVDEEKQLAAIQCSTELYFVDYGSLCFELFYQIGLAGFANFGTIKLEPELLLVELLEILLESLECDPVASKKIIDASKIIIDYREMLYEYFSFGVTSDGKIYSLPLLLKDYIPNIGKLPLFIYRLCIKVNWNQEKECFCTFLRELALFYSPEPLFQKQYDIETYENEKKILSKALECVLFPAFKKRLIGTIELSRKRNVVEVVTLPKLYKVFERC